MNTTIPITFALSLISLCAPSARAQQPDAAQSASQRALERFRQAPEATIRSFLRAGTASAPLLKSLASIKSIDKELRSVIRRAHTLCSVDAPVVKGLKLGLASEAAALPSGSSTTFTVTLCNVSDEPIEIDAGMSFSGNVFANGSLFELLDEHGEVVERSGYVVGFCGTGAHPLTETIAPLDFRRFTFKAIHRSGRDAATGDATDGPHLSMRHVQLRLPEPAAATRGPLRLRLRHDVSKSDSTLFMGQATRRWNHVLVSNTLELPTAVTLHCGNCEGDTKPLPPAGR